MEDSLGSVPKAEAICKRLVGRSPWEFLLDDRLGGILMAVYDLIGQAASLPVSKLFAANPKSHIVQTWWSQCFPPGLMASEAKLGYELGYRVHKVKATRLRRPGRASRSGHLLRARRPESLGRRQQHLGHS